MRQSPKPVHWNIFGYFVLGFLSAPVAEEEEEEDLDMADYLGAVMGGRASVDGGEMKEEKNKKKKKKGKGK